MSFISGFLSSGIFGALFAINYAIAFFAGLFFMLGSKLVEWTLALNSDVIIQPAVTVGWSITLSFANLGFVLAIIVIAFATILRKESYGMKQILWKLVIAALLVNFSLVIAGAFISVSDMITKTFQDASKLGPLTAGSTLAGLFQINRLMMVSEGSCYFVEREFSDTSMGVCKKEDEGKTYEQVNPGLWERLKAGLKGGNLIGGESYKCECSLEAEAIEAGTSADPLKEAASILFTIVFSFLGILTLFATAIMLLIRFVVLGILLVLSPLALLLWIFPATQSHWQKWWSEFIRWTFFAPIVSFFFYLAVQSTFLLQRVDTGNPLSVELEKAIRQTGILETMGNMIMMAGFMLGGLYVANSLSITGAKVFYGVAQGAGKGFAQWSKKGAPKAGGWALRKTGLGDKAAKYFEDKSKQYGGQNTRTGRLLSKMGSGAYRVTEYKAPSLYRSVMSGIQKQTGKEPMSRTEQLQKKIDDLNKKRESLEKGLNRMGNLLANGQIAQSQYDKIKDNIEEQQKNIDKAISEAALKF